MAFLHNYSIIFVTRHNKFLFSYFYFSPYLFLLKFFTHSIHFNSVFSLRTILALSQPS